MGVIFSNSTLSTNQLAIRFQTFLNFPLSGSHKNMFFCFVFFVFLNLNFNDYCLNYLGNERL